jgi:hypothetical protein
MTDRDSPLDGDVLRRMYFPEEVEQPPKPLEASDATLTDSRGESIPTAVSPEHAQKILKRFTEVTFRLQTAAEGTVTSSPRNEEEADRSLRSDPSVLRVNPLIRKTSMPREKYLSMETRELYEFLYGDSKLKQRVPMGSPSRPRELSARGTTTSSSRRSVNDRLHVCLTIASCVFVAIAIAVALVLSAKVLFIDDTISLRAHFSTFLGDDDDSDDVGLAASNRRTLEQIQQELLQSRQPYDTFILEEAHGRQPQPERYSNGKFHRHQREWSGERKPATAATSYDNYIHSLYQEAREAGWIVPVDISLRDPNSSAAEKAILLGLRPNAKIAYHTDRSFTDEVKRHGAVSSLVRGEGQLWSDRTVS